jgi:cell division transport system ATP-binding protein
LFSHFSKFIVVLAGVAIKVQDAAIYQDTSLILDQVNFDIYHGEFVFLSGGTGQGKSSLLRTLYLDLPLHTGYIEVCGFDLRAISKKDIPFLRRKLGIVFQDFQLLMDRSIEENLQFVLRSTGWNSEADIKKQIYNCLMRVGLHSVEKKLPHQLSGGEQQRVVIARALLNDPLVILADEPTGNLDPDTGAEILSIFKKINKEGTVVIMATHNYQFIADNTMRNIVCSNGRVEIK